MYFWPGLIYALVQYTYTRDIANNYWYAKLASLVMTPIGICASFYGYLAISLPLYGTGFFRMDLLTMVIGLTLGSVVAYKIMIKPPLSKPTKNAVLAGYLAMLACFLHLPTILRKFFCSRIILVMSTAENTGYSKIKNPTASLEKNS